MYMDNLQLQSASRLLIIFIEDSSGELFAGVCPQD